MKVKVGRPTKMTSLTLKKLEEAFAFGCSDEEACFYADISRQTLYDYQKICPEFIDRKEALKARPILKARETVVKKLSETYQNAMDYLKRKKKKEFGDSQDITSGGKPIPILGNVYTDNSNKEDISVEEED